MLAHLQRVLRKLLVPHHVQHGQRGRAGERIAAGGAGHLAHAHGIEDLALPRERGTGHAAADALAHADHVRSQILPLQHEHLAGPPERGLHFVQDEQQSPIMGPLLQLLQPALRRKDEPGPALVRLGDHRAEVAGGGRFDDAVEALDAPLAALLFGFAVIEVSVEIGERGQDGPRKLGAELPLGLHTSRNADRPVRAPVKPSVERQNLVPAGVPFRDPNRRLGGLPAGGQQEDLVHIIRQQIGQPLRERDALRGGEGVAVHQPARLPADRLHVIRMGVSQVGDQHAGGEVYVLVPIHVRHPDALPVIPDHRHLIGHTWGLIRSGDLEQFGGLRAGNDPLLQLFRHRFLHIGDTDDTDRTDSHG